MPITWKNINQPNFGAANSLLLGSTRTMSDAFSNLSDRFINQGEYNKERNTGEAIAAASQLDDLNSFGSARQDAMAALLGKNIDQTAVSAAYDDRRGFLQDNVTFAQERDAADFEAQNRDRLLQEDLLDRASGRAKDQAYISSVAQTARNQITGEEQSLIQAGINAATQVDPDTGKLTFDDDYYAKVMQGSGIPSAKVLKGKTNYLDTSGINIRRTADSERGKSTSWSKVLTPPKDLQSDDLDLFEFDSGAKRAWGIKAQELKDKGYSATQALRLLQLGYNANDNWDDDRSALTEGVEQTPPQYNKPK